METDGGDKTSLCKPQPTFQFLWQYFSPRCVCVCLFVAYRDLWEPRSSCSRAIGNGDLPHILSLRNHNLKSVYRALSETEIKPTHLAFTELNYRYETQPLPFPCNNPAPKHSNARARNARVRHSSQPGFAREREGGREGEEEGEEERERREGRETEGEIERACAWCTTPRASREKT